MTDAQAKQGDDEDERLDDASAPTSDVPETAAAPRWLIDFRRSFSKGFYNSLGDFALAFADRGSDQLLVSFDNLSSARDDSIDRDPWGYSFAAKNGWSQLGVMAFKANWFRDEELFSELRKLADSGFFKRFKSVTMTGTSMGGYAACAFASLVPGCNVIAFSPQSTLKKSLVPWEERFSSGRKADWSGDFADGAVESAAAGKVWMIYDPLFEPDVQHAERFTNSNVIMLPARYSGHKSALFLRRAGILSTVVRQAMSNDLTATSFFEAYRRGRELPWYLLGIADRMVNGQHSRLMPHLISVVQKMNAPSVLRNVEDRALAAGMIKRRDRSANKPKGKDQGQGQGQGQARGRQAKPAGNAQPQIPDPAPAPDLYMQSPDLPPPLPNADGVWTDFEATQNRTGQKLPWQSLAG